MFWNKSGKKEEKITQVSDLGPWFLPRDFPMSGNTDYHIWKERRNAAEFSVATHVLDGHMPGMDEIRSIAAHVMGRDSKPQDQNGMCATTYRLAVREFFEGRVIDEKNLDMPTLSEKVAETARRIYGIELIPGKMFLERMQMFLRCALVLNQSNITWKTGENLALFYNLMQRHYTDMIKGDRVPETVLRLFARQVLLEKCGILLRWEIFTFDPYMREQFNWYGDRLNGSFFRDMMEADA